MCIFPGVSVVTEVGQLWSRESTVCKITVTLSLGSWFLLFCCFVIRDVHESSSTGGTQLACLTAHV